ncbi:MAG: hypothetical protein WCD18_10930 [Thermosynechococcaceae cyanobacterium]
MTDINNLFPSKDIQSAFVKLKDEVSKVESELLELQKKKYEVLQNQLDVCSLNLATLASNINTLSNQLECELSNFKQYFFEFETIYHTIQSISTSTNYESNRKSINHFLLDSQIWRLVPTDISIPIVVQQESQFFLTAKSVDFQQKVVQENNA